MTEATAIEQAFWDAIPDDNTLDELADGMIVNFTFEGKDYSVDTKIFETPRIHPIMDYFDGLSERINNLIGGK